MGLSKNRFPNPSFVLVDAAMPASSFPDNTLIQTARGWFIDSFADGGTPIALAASQQAFAPTQNSVPGEPTQYLRLAFSSAGASLGPNSFLKLVTRLSALVLNGRYATFSFWMSSDVATRPVTMAMRRSYGTGGSPSPDDVFPIIGAGIAPAQILAIPRWQRYALTAALLPTNDPARPKVFGSNNDAYLELALYFQAGPGLGIPGGATISPASNVILIAQPQLEVGTVATSWEDGDVGGGFIGAYTGVLNLASGQNSVTVTAANLPFTPTDVRFSPRKAGSGSDLFSAVLRGAPTRDGFTADLTFSPPDGTYQLGYEYVP